jgi:periplasmic divalent cation tolerance protein
MSGHAMLMTTTPTHEDAVRIARLLVEERLAACVQLMPIQSFYHWKEKTQQDAETLMLVKTRKALLEKTIARIKDVHRYEVPEIVATELIAGFSGYFEWMDKVTSAPHDNP